MAQQLFKHKTTDFGFTVNGSGQKTPRRVQRQHTESYATAPTQNKSERTVKRYSRLSQGSEEADWQGLRAQPLGGGSGIGNPRRVSTGQQNQRYGGLGIGGLGAGSLGIGGQNAIHQPPNVLESLIEQQQPGLHQGPIHPPPPQNSVADKIKLDEDHLRSLLGELEPGLIDRLHEVHESVENVWKKLDYDGDGNVEREDVKGMLAKVWAELAMQMDAQIEEDDFHTKYLDMKQFSDIFVHACQTMNADPGGVARLDHLDRQRLVRERERARQRKTFVKDRRGSRFFSEDGSESDKKIVFPPTPHASKTPMGGRKSVFRPQGDDAAHSHRADQQFDGQHGHGPPMQGVMQGSKRPNRRPSIGHH